VSDLYAAHASGSVNHGINIEEPGTTDMVARKVLPCLM
jgi:hypothetical protein